ncbi:MAG: YbaY family lipoprotein [Pseudomonadales bacterium]|nr:YbaY family lipoprotein [Pseudomonadales bacterium]
MTASSVTQWFATALAAVVLLAGCNQGTPDAADDNAQRVLTGKVLYRERIAMPEGATVSVTLADVSLADAPAKPIAEQHIDNPGQVPVAFELRYDPATLEHDHPMAYAVRAQIRDRDDNLLWTTTERHTVTLTGDSVDQEVTLMLQRVADDATGSKPLTGMEKAKAKGASFWATGNEPGWHLAIYPEERLDFVGDYGDTHVITPDPGAMVEGSETLYATEADGTPLRVEIAEEPCQDSMSGAAFDYAVTVSLGETLYRGCGKDL